MKTIKNHANKTWQVPLAIDPPLKALRPQQEEPADDVVVAGEFSDVPEVPVHHHY